MKNEETKTIRYFSMFTGVGGYIYKPPMLVEFMVNKYTAQKVDMEKAKQLYESGMTQLEVAKSLGTSQKIIYMRFKKEGYKCRVAKKRNQFGENNDSWKCGKAGYKALHYRVNNSRGKPKECEQCGTKKAKRYEWASMTGDYANPKDYKRLCKSCHSKKDNVINNINGGDLCQ